MKRILVTGGAGFIGSHLIERLVGQGHSVTCLDNFLTGNIRNIPPELGVNIIECDVTDFKTQVYYDEIYNLAAAASPVHYQADPVHTITTSVSGTLNILNLAKNTGAKVLQASTSEVYGDPLVHPQVEDYFGNVNTWGPRACYDEGKRCAETLCYDFQKKGVEVRVARIFNTYGPNMHPDDGRVVSNFIVQGLRGEKFTIYGTGTQTRSFCYVKDMVEGLLSLMNSSCTSPVNIGNPSEFTILELCKKVCSELEIEDFNSRLSFSDLPQNDPLQRKPVIKKAEKELNWKPKVDLDKGLESTVEYFRNIL
jgi:UDP-glucuronate decarboxylase